MTSEEKETEDKERIEKRYEVVKRIEGKKLWKVWDLPKNKQSMKEEKP